MLKKLIGQIKRIWHDNVWGTVIAELIILVGGILIPNLLSNVQVVSCVFSIKVPLYLCFIEFAVFFFVIARLFFYCRMLNKGYQEKDCKIGELNNNVLKLHDEINELKKEPDNPRMSQFNMGDVVIIKGSDACWNVTEYTVVGKDKNLVILNDNKGDEKRISPDALLTVKEYEIEKQRQQNEISMVYNRSRPMNPWQF